MPALCSQCGKTMMLGRVTPTGVEGLGEPALSFIVGAGAPTSLNAITAVLQGMRGEPPYREEISPIRGRVCPDCGRVEFFIDPEDLTRITRLVGSAETGSREAPNQAAAPDAAADRPGE